jgi:hypothetical protein
MLTCQITVKCFIHRLVHPSRSNRLPRLVLGVVGMKFLCNM